jgi:hypothetical protein
MVMPMAPLTGEMSLVLPRRGSGVVEGWRSGLTPVPVDGGGVFGLIVNEARLGRCERRGRAGRCSLSRVLPAAGNILLLSCIQGVDEDAD